MSITEHYVLYTIYYIYIINNIYTYEYMIIYIYIWLCDQILVYLCTCEIMRSSPCSQPPSNRRSWAQHQGPNLQRWHPVTQRSSRDAACFHHVTTYFATYSTSIGTAGIIFYLLLAISHVLLTSFEIHHSISASKFSCSTSQSDGTLQFLFNGEGNLNPAAKLKLC